MSYLNNIKQTWKVVWITGASQGIGRDLALAMARLGINIAASARSVDKLNELVADARELAGTITAFPADITDANAISAVVDKIEHELGAIDLAVLNAGTFVPMSSRHFDSKIIQSQFQLNFMGTCHCIEPLVALFTDRNKGHIAINASLAGYRGLPKSGGYGASKAALINLAESMRLELCKYQIKVQVINPGFIRTPLTDKNKFPMPFLMDSDKAAVAIIRGLVSSSFEIRFPVFFGWIMGFMKLLPYGLYFKFAGKL